MDVIESLSKTEKGKLHYDRQCLASPNVKKLLQTIHEQSSDHIIVSSSTLPSPTTKCEQNVSPNVHSRDRPSLSPVRDSPYVTNNDSSQVTAVSHRLLDRLIQNTLINHQTDARCHALDRLSTLTHQLCQLRRQHSNRCRQLLVTEQLHAHQLQQQQQLDEKLVGSRLEQHVALAQQQKQLDSQEVMDRAASVQQKQHQISTEQSAMLTQFVSHQQLFRAQAARVIDLMKLSDSLSSYISSDITAVSGRELKSLMLEMDSITARLDDPAAIDRSGEIVKAVETLALNLKTACDEAEETKKAKLSTPEVDCVPNKQDPSTANINTPTIPLAPPTRSLAPPTISLAAPTISDAPPTQTVLATPTNIDQSDVDHASSVAPPLSSTKNVVFVFEDDLKHYNQLKTELEALQQKFSPFLSDTNMKSQRAACLKAVNTRLNSLGAHNMAVNIAALNSLLSGEIPSTTGTSATSSGAHQQQISVHYCVDLLARMFVRQGEDVVSAGAVTAASSEQLSASAAAAERLAQLMTQLWSRHAQLVSAVLAYFYRRCPYLLPLTPRRRGGESEPDYLRRCGYQVSSSDDGAYKLEAQQLFLRRMSGAARLYATLLITNSSTINTNTPHTSSCHGDREMPGIHTLWLWLASVVRVYPLPGVSASVMEAVLETAQRQLHAAYGRQFVKLCRLILQHYLPALAQVTDEGGRGSLLRLEKLLTNFTQSTS